MAVEQQHIIRQLALEFNTPPAREGQDYHALSERLSVLGTEQIPEILERVLSDLVPPGTYVRYDKMVLDCNVEHWDELEMVIRQQLAEQLEAILTEEKPLASPVKKVTGPKSSPERKTVVGPAAWLRHFLRYGFLPWSAPRSLSQSALSYELAELLANQQGFAEQLYQDILTDIQILLRLWQQFGERMLLRLLKAQGGILEKKQVLQLLQRVEAYQRKDLASLAEFWRKQLEALPNPQDQDASIMREVPKIATFPTAGQAKGRFFLGEEVGRAEQAVYINNAGLVLLHPFMRRFLQLHQATADKEVLDLPLAATLLQSLVAGQETAAEWELVLPKILLGQSLARPLNPMVLNQEHLASGEELISAAVKHWSSLGTTSTAGFRANFLQREGMLVAKGNDWHLRVQKAPYDMLLDTLPWGVSMIKLPWMEGMLQVDWG